MVIDSAPSPGVCREVFEGDRDGHHLGDEAGTERSCGPLQLGAVVIGVDDPCSSPDAEEP